MNILNSQYIILSSVKMYFIAMFCLQLLYGFNVIKSFFLNDGSDVYLD